MSYDVFSIYRDFNMLLSLVIPFFNSEKKSKRLLETLAKIKQKDVEFVLINDGSTDGTYGLLKQFKASLLESNVALIDQDNRGPGGARNSGLKIAKGKYVWFVDSDDDITLESIDIVRENANSDYDFIDFNIEKSKELLNSMDLEAGEYIVTDDSRIKLLQKFGRISSKAVSRKLLIENNIFYPEYCVYEDNPLRFIYPFFVRKFLKVQAIGYIHHLEFESITRSKPSLRTYDRLYTAIYGLEAGLKLATNSEEVRVLEEMFIEKYMIESAMKFYSIKPSRYWLTTWRVMKQYRSLEKRFNIKIKPFDAIEASRFHPKVKSYLKIQWALSHSIRTDQTRYFDNIRKKTWNL